MTARSRPTCGQPRPRSRVGCRATGSSGSTHGTNRSLTIEVMTVTDAEFALGARSPRPRLPASPSARSRSIASQDPTLVRSTHPALRRGRCGRSSSAGGSSPVGRDGGAGAAVHGAAAGRRGVPAQPLPGRGLRVVQERADRRRARHGRRGASCAACSTLLARFGIFARVRRKDDRATRPARYMVLCRSSRCRATTGSPTSMPFIDSAQAEQARGDRSTLAGHRATRASKRLEIERIEDRRRDGRLRHPDRERRVPVSGGLRVHNCFILAVDDTMDSILNWYREEGIIFKGGSGAGTTCRTSARASSSSTAAARRPGPVSFMRGADASAGTIKSGGKTRRAAKMVILNADHPDIEEFIWCKAIEERKARVLSDAGFDMDLDGRDAFSVQYQNANNSVRVTDEFMQAVVVRRRLGAQGRHHRRAVRTVKARDLWRQIAAAAWECADPGIQFDTTINRWHTAANTGRINASNPCCGVSCTSTTQRVQSRLDQPAGVPRRRPLRRRRLPAHRRDGVHGPGDPRRPRRLPDREDRRERPRLPPARPRLHQPRRAADGARAALRLARRDGRGRRRSRR